jgi:hypothetical protein
MLHGGGSGNLRVFKYKLLARIMSLTLSAQEILKNLLRSQPHISAWLHFCDVSIANSEPVPSYGWFTTLNITCDLEAVAELWVKSQNAWLSLVSKGVPMEINLLYKTDLIATWSERQLKFQKHNLKLNTMSVQTINTTDQQSAQAIDLKRIPNPISKMICQQVAALQLPVYLRSDGDGYNLPETSFDIAWQNIGEAFKRSEEFFLTEEEGEGEQANAASTKKTSKKDYPKNITKLFKIKFTIADIDLGRYGARKTISNLLTKLNRGSKSDEEILNSIIENNEYGLRLLAKLKETYKKRDPLMNDDGWVKTEQKLLQSIKVMLSKGDPESVNTEEAKVELQSPENSQMVQ